MPSSTVLLFDREEEIAKLQHIFVETFRQQLLLDSGEDAASVTTSTTNSTGGYSTTENDGNDLYSPTMHHSSSGGSSSRRHKKKKRERLKAWAEAARAQSATSSSSSSVVNTTRHVAILVSPAGTGKSALIQTALQPLVEQSCGYFLTGESCSHESNHVGLPPPLTTFVNLINRWLHQIFKRRRRNGDVISKIQRELQMNLDPTELVTLLHVFPLLKEHITHPRPRQQHNVTQTCNNFAVTFRTLFRIIASALPNTPIVIFLDDLHELCVIDDTTSTQINEESFHSASTCNSTRSKITPAFLQGQPAKTHSSATLVLGLIQWLLLDIQNIPNLLVALAFQPVPFHHPLTNFLQQLENTPLAKQGRINFCPIVCQNLSETDIYQWLHHVFCAEGNELSADTLHDMATQIIQRGLLTAHGNPLATRLLLEQVQNLALKQEEMDVPAALSVMVAKLERMEKIKRRRQLAKETEAASNSNSSRHGRRFQNAKTAQDGLMESLNASLTDLRTDESSTVDDDPALVVLSRHLQLLVDGKLKSPTKRLCYLVTAYCVGKQHGSDPQCISMSTEQLRTVWKLFDTDGSSDGVNDAVADAVASGMFQLLEKSSSSKKSNGKEFLLAFTCPTFRDVMYSHIMTSSAKSEYHAKLALSLYENNSRDIFTTVTHLQRGFEDLGTQTQQRLATWCLEAGKQAIEWSQFETACQFFTVGIRTLEHCIGGLSGVSSPPVSPRKSSKGNGIASTWTASTATYDANLELHLGLALACLHLKHFEDAQNYVDEALYHIKHSSRSKENSTKSTVERAKATAILIQCHVQNQQYSDAIHTGIKILGKLGENSISASDTKGDSGQESDAKSVRKLLGNLLKSNNSSGNSNKRLAANAIVESMPILMDQKSLEAIHIYNLLLGPALMEQASLISAISHRIVKLTLQSGGGLCPCSAIGFMSMASILYSMGDVENGVFCECLANEINDVFQDKTTRGRLLVVQNSLSLPRRDFPQQLKIAYRLCNDVADQEFAMLSTIVSVSNLFVAGGPLNATAEAMKGVYQVLSTRNNQRLLFVLRPLFQMALNLLGVESTRAAQEKNHHDPHILQGNIIASEDQEIEYAKETRNIKAEFAIYLAKATLCFYMHKFELCREVIDKSYSLPRSEISVLVSLEVQWLFLDAMSAICFLWKQSKHADSKDVARLKKKNVAIAERCLKDLEAHAAASPDLVDQKIYMIKAELQVLSGQIEGALQLFSKAMDHSEGYDITSDRALACERAGLALRANHRDDEALDYLEDSLLYYRQYGSLAKVNHVKGNVIPGWDD